jgi:hypothetical protein
MVQAAATLERAAARELQVRVAETEADRRRVYAFRWRVQVEELKLDPPGADRKAELVRDELDDAAVHLFVTQAGETQAALRLLPGAAAVLPQALREAHLLERFACWGDAALSFSDELLVARAWRKSAIPAVLLGAAYKLLRRQGVRFDFCRCPPALIGLFQKLGYRRYAKNYVDPQAGLQTPMALVLDDLPHLVEMNSPFAPYALKRPNPDDAAQWFRREFPEAERYVGKRMRDEERFWVYLTEQLHQTPLVGLPLLNGLSFAEAKQMLGRATVLNLEAGERLVRAGDLGSEMFLLLSGAAEARAPGPGAKRIAAFRPGALFGEIAFLSALPRSADVVATMDSEVLVLTQDVLQRIMQAQPAVAARLLFNLSLILCQRLRDSTKSLAAA